MILYLPPLFKRDTKSTRLSTTKRTGFFYASLSCLIMLLAAPISYANNETLSIGVAANFTATLKQLTQEFAQKYPNHQAIRTRIVSGSSGHLYHQIIQGAPLDIFFSANKRYIDQLAARYRTHNLPQTTYAIGRLALWHPNYSKKGNTDNQSSLLFSLLRNHQAVALANPKLAPFGSAANDILQTTPETLRSKLKIVTANNVSQVYTWVYSGNIPLGFVSYADLLRHNIQSDYYTLIDQNRYTPIQQTMMILPKGNNKTVATAFFNFLRTAHANTIIQQSGYWSHLRNQPKHPGTIEPDKPHITSDENITPSNEGISHD